MKIINTALFFISILFLFGCSPSVNVMKYTEEVYQPTSSVEVLRSKPVEKEYLELGELSLRIKKGLIFNNQEEAVFKLKDKAKEIGADAIIILGEETEGATIIDDDTVVAKRYLKAIAIKYKNYK